MHNKSFLSNGFKKHQLHGLRVPCQPLLQRHISFEIFCHTGLVKNLSKTSIPWKTYCTTWCNKWKHPWIHNIPKLTKQLEAFREQQGVGRKRLSHYLVEPPHPQALGSVCAMIRSTQSIATQRRSMLFLGSISEASFHIRMLYLQKRDVLRCLVCFIYCFFFLYLSCNLWTGSWGYLRGSWW